THMVNYVDVRYRTGRRRLTAPQSGLKEVDEVRAPGVSLVTQPRIGGTHE
ncbi:amino acid ABC transporter permease, partial [Pantoea sp. M_5]